MFNELDRLPEQFKECATIETWEENAMIDCQPAKPYNEQQLAINHDLPPPSELSEATAKNMKWGDYSYTYTVSHYNRPNPKSVNL